MPGPPPKPAAIRQNKIKRPELSIVRSVPLDIPEPPTGLLKATLERWNAYWGSQVAQIARDSAGVDLPGLERWILNVDEWSRAMRALRKERVVAGSMGQATLNPLAAYVAQREAAIRDAEVAYGMTPLARLKLGLAVGQMKLTAQALNASLEAPDDASDALSGDWDQA